MTGKKFLLTLILTLFVVIPAFAQKETGAIIGHVTSNDAPVPGAMITASSPALIGGSAVMYTGKDGFYKFPALRPGTYELKSELQGFQTIVRKDIRLFVGQTVTVDFDAQAQAAGEVLEISGETPLIDATTPAVSNTVPVETIENLPKFSFALDLFTLTPGVGDADLQYVAYGAGGEAANAYWFDGVDISNPVTGAIWVYPNYNWIEEVSVVGIGAPAEYGGYTGVVTNSVSRSGSNEFHGLFETFWQNESTTSSNTEDLGVSPPQTDLFSDNTAQLGGPIVRDRLWFFSGLNYYYNRDVPFGYPPDQSDAKRTNEQRKWINKLTGKINEKNNVQGFIEWDDYFTEGFGADAFTLPEATAREDWSEWFWNAGWTSLLKPETLLDVRTSGFNSDYGYQPKDPNKPGRYSYNTALYTDNYYYTYDTHRYRNQVNGSLSHHARDFMKGEHDFKFGVEYERSNAVRDQRYPGGAFYYDYVGQGYYYYYTGPYYRILWEGYDTNTTINRVSTFAQDSWSVNDKLTLSLGVRYDHNRAHLEGTDIRYSTSPVAPRIGFVYDLHGDQTTVFKAHYGHYHEGLVTFFIDGIDNYGDKLTQYFNPDTGQWYDWSFTPGASVWTIDDNLKQPYTRQFTVGVDKLLPHDVALSAHYIYQRSKDLLEDVDAIGQYEPVIVTNPLTGEPLTVFNRSNPGSEEFFIKNPAGLFRQYHGLQITGNKRFSDKFSLTGSFVIQKATGNVNNTNAGADGFSTVLDSPNDQINNEGRLTHDNTYEIKLHGFYNLPWEVLSSFYFRHFSGDTWTPVIRIRGLDQGNIFLFGEPRGSRRLPGRNILDLRLEKGVPVFNGDLKFTVDFFNIFNTGYVLNVDEEVANSTFGQTQSFSAPREIRLGVRYKF
jgi:outer membrane receptor protein involved in Fe transport